jgi:AcrR family transcriptional regulator
MPRHVDSAQRDHEIRRATLRVVARHGVNGVTIRRVAGELGTSTSAITHFTRNKDDLLGRVISAELDDRRRQITDLVASAEDPFWAVVSWSVEADPDGVWPALVSATAAGVAPAIGQLVRDFDAWWTDLIIQLVEGRLIDGLSERDAADAVGVVADGLLLALDSGDWSSAHRHRLARTLIGPLLSR